MVDEKRISCFPYGGWYAIPATCTVLGLIFYHIAAFGCTTFKATLIGYYLNSYSTKFGYWGVDSGSGCISYGGYEVSGAFKFGRFVGIVGALIIWAIFGAMVAASFLKLPKVALKIIGGCMGLISLFSFLLLVGLSETGSEVGGGAVLAILSALIWSGGAVSMFLCMKERTQSAPAGSSNKPKASTTTDTATTTNTDKAPDTTANDDPDIPVDGEDNA